MATQQKNDNKQESKGTTGAQGSENGQPGQQGQPGTPEQLQREQQGGTEESNGNGQQEGNGNREAAKYRTQLRSVEQERDTANATVDSLRRQLVAGNMPHGSGISANALWTAGRKPADMFDDKGQLDTEKLRTTVKAVHTELGVTSQAGVVRDSGTGSGSDEGPTTLAGELRKKKK